MLQPDCSSAAPERVLKLLSCGFLSAFSIFFQPFCFFLSFTCFIYCFYISIKREQQYSPASLADDLHTLREDIPGHLPLNAAL